MIERRHNRKRISPAQGLFLFVCAKMKRYFLYEGPVLSDNHEIDICKTMVCAENRKDAYHKIIHQYKVKNGYASDEDIRIEETKIIGGYETD